MVSPSHIPDEVFVPRWGLRGAHRQTLAGNFLPRRSRLPKSVRRLFQVEDGVQVLCECHWQPERRKSLTVILVHGLEGSSESQYVVGTASKAFDAGMNVVRMNMRNCGGTEALGHTLYHSGLSGDVGAVARALVQEDGLSRITLVGYSMGGNVVLKLAGEWGQQTPPEVRAAAAVSPAMDLGPSADALHRWQNRVYEWKFLWSLQRRYRRKAALFPDRYSRHGVGWTKMRSLRQFDDKITAPCSGFSSAADYYLRASASRVAEHIAIPTLIIHSEDDPFIRLLPETRFRLRANPHVCFLETKYGGHCAFLAAANGYDGRWAERQIISFLTVF